MTLFFDKTWSILLGERLSDVNYWIANNQIPLGTRRPYNEYRGQIPESEIVTIPFDSVDKPKTAREAFHIMLLGGSGDGKSMMKKAIWSVLDEAGYHTMYFDPKGTDVGRARVGWESPRMAPHMKSQGIKLRHFMPVWGMRNYESISHNLEIYSNRLSKINSFEMWRGLGMSETIAPICESIITENGEAATVDNIIFTLNTLKSDEALKVSADSAKRILNSLQRDKFIDKNFPELDVEQVWKEEKAVCITYSLASSSKLITFDIGQKIDTVQNLIDRKVINKPCMLFFDDASVYLDDSQRFRRLVPYNYAEGKIMNIGNLLRTKGIGNCLAIQSLANVSQAVAETYKIKIISPFFSNPESLYKINVPKEAIDLIKNNELYQDSDTHTLEWVLVMRQKVIRFFPFTPRCNHMTEIYFEKDDVVETQ